MTLVWLLTVALALWFGFELGRKWSAGEEEADFTEREERTERGGVKLRRISIRR